MRVGLVYPFVSASSFRPETDYVAGAKRFADTLKQFPAGHGFQLWVVNTNSGGASEIFKDTPTMWDEYRGEGLDVGVWMHAARNLIDYDMLVFSNSLAYFTTEGWLAALVDARKRYGDGLYGYFASFENNPHIRTTMWACNPKTLMLYPEKIVTRQDTLDFESGPKRFGRFVEKRKEPVLWVARDGVYDQQEWQNVGNGFRCGDQSNLWVADRHTLLYSQAVTEEKEALNKTSWSVK